MRALWSGNLLFNVILIPVRMGSASEELKVPFNQIHKDDEGRIRYKKFCEICGKEMKADEIIKGYEVGGKIIRFTDEELEALKPVSSRSMRIIMFCDEKEVPLIALDTPYYLVTETRKKGGVGAPFALLRQAMMRKNKVAIVDWVSRTSEHIGMLVPYENGFMVKLLLYDKQIRPFNREEVIDADVDPKILSMGERLIDTMTDHFDIRKYRESYTDELVHIIEMKALGQEVKIEPIKPPEARTLEEQLKQALEAKAS